MHLGGQWAWLMSLMIIGSDISNQRGDMDVIWHDISTRGCDCDLVRYFFSQGIGDEE